MNTRWNSPHLTVATVVEHKQRFLCVEERVNGELVINQPAGHVENGESLIDAAVRETYEETGWKIQPTALLPIYRWDHPKSGESFFRITFCAKTVAFDAEQVLDDGIVQALWLKPTELQQYTLRSPMVTRCIDDYLAQQQHSLDLLVNLL